MTTLTLHEKTQAKIQAALKARSDLLSMSFDRTSLSAMATQAHAAQKFVQAVRTAIAAHSREFNV